MSFDQNVRSNGVSPQKSLLGRPVIECALLVALIFLTLLVIGCAGEPSKLSQLDRNRGLGPYVLGDSMYSQVAQTANDSLTSRLGSEMEILGHIVSWPVPVTFGSRFLFGVEVDGAFAGTLDGRVTNYTIYNQDLASARVSALVDSLRAHYGPPTHRIDSVLHVAGTPLPKADRLSRSKVIETAVERGFLDEASPASVDSVTTVRAHVWRGDRTHLQLYAQTASGEGGGYAISLLDRRAVEQLHQTSLEVDSMLKAGAVGPITEVGGLDLMTTSQSSQFVSTQRERILGSGTYTTYSVSYDQVAPFFGIEQTPRYRSADDIGAVQPSIEFRASRGDSLQYVRFQFQREVPDPDSRYASMTYATYDRIAAPMREAFGDPALVVQITDPEAGRQYPVGFWPGAPFTGFVEARNDQMIAGFDRTDPGDVGTDILRQHFSYYHLPGVDASALMPLTETR